MVPFPRNERFIGGTQKIDRIRAKFEEDNFFGHQRLAIWGLGGVGYDGFLTEFNNYAC
jgi:hypothetical protein